MLSWLNRDGGCSKTETLSFIEFLKTSVSRKKILYTPRKATTLLLLGGVLIWTAQAVIRDGVKWQVGNGQHINIWKDKWTNNPTTFRIFSPQRILPMEEKVSALIDVESGAWKTNMIREVFLEHEADSILSIPLSTTLLADRLVWIANANGKFNVKSAYHLARNGGRSDDGERSDPSGMHRFWQRLWKAKVPNKVRNFGWRACQNILPTKMNLFHRKVIDNPTCEECGLCPETAVHVLCHCTKAKAVWSHCNLSSMTEGQGDFMDILWQCVMNQGNASSLMDMILMIAWSIC